MRNGGGGAAGSIISLLLVIGLFFFIKSAGGEEGFSGGLAKGLDSISSGLEKAVNGANDAVGKKTDEINGNSGGNGKPSGNYVEGQFIEALGEAKIEHPEPELNEIVYLPIDSRGRAKGAYGTIGYNNYQEYKKRGRQSITVNPSGWGQNKEVTIVGVDKDGNDKRYHGWFYNRSHLIADSLGGHPEADNLVTGTRMQNVGWNDSEGGGMAYLEVKVRNFVKDPKNKDCGVYYSAKPVYYDDNELLPKTVIVDARSCNNQINERVAVYNVAPGYEIDYTNGNFSKKSEDKSEEKNSSDTGNNPEQKENSKENDTGDIAGSRR